MSPAASTLEMQLQQSTRHIARLPDGHQAMIRIWLVLVLMLFAPGCGKEKAVVSVTPADPCTSLPGAIYPTHQTGPSWSRDGLIAYSDRGVVCVQSNGGYSVDTSLAGIYIVDPVSMVKRRLTAFGEDPAWSPDGRSLAFETGGEIFVINADGTSLRQITFSGVSLRPAWHPDGNRITFETYPGTGPIIYHLWIVGADGSDPHALCNADTAGARASAWHPDGKRYLYTRFGPSLSIFESDTTACSKVRLTTSPGDDNDPTFSPTGDRIAFTRLTNPPPQIWVMNADGSNQRQLTTTGGKDPSWAPDGTTIVYTRSDFTQICPEQGVLWTVNVSGGRQGQLLEPWPSRCGSLASRPGEIMGHRE